MQDSSLKAEMMTDTNGKPLSSASYTTWFPFLPRLKTINITG
jgi:hypothetical protein